MKNKLQILATVALHVLIFSPMSRRGRLLKKALLFCMGQGICGHGPPFIPLSMETQIMGRNMRG